MVDALSLPTERRFILTLLSRKEERTDLMRVQLYVYDLHGSNDLFSSFGLGFYHSSVVVEGLEYSYAPDVGMYDTSPLSAPPNAVFKGSVDMGEFQGGKARLAKALDSLRRRFRPDAYDVLSNNCNNFADALVFELVGKHVPSWVNRAAQLGTCVSCLRPPIKAHASGETSFQPFGGQGYSFEQPPTNRMNERTTGGDSVDRRNKMGAAALRRIDAHA